MSHVEGASTGLHWSVLTARRPGLSRDLPPGQEKRTWVANSSTLISGERDAVLVDTFLTTEQSQTLLDWVVASPFSPAGAASAMARVISATAGALRAGAA
jgi:hypothetical protein